MACLASGGSAGIQDPLAGNRFEQWSDELGALVLNGTQPLFKGSEFPRRSAIFQEDRRFRQFPRRDRDALFLQVIQEFFPADPGSVDPQGERRCPVKSLKDLPGTLHTVTIYQTLHQPPGSGGGELDMPYGSVIQSRYWRRSRICDLAKDRVDEG